jgi:translation elongation factor EF-G
MINLKINNNLDKVINKLDKVNIEIQTAFSEVAMSKGEFIRTALNDRYENLFEGADISFAPEQYGMKVNIVFAGKNYWKFVNGYKFNMQEMHGMVNTLVADIVKESLNNSLRGNSIG